MTVKERITALREVMAEKKINIAIKSALLISSFSIVFSFPAVPLLQLYYIPNEPICQSFFTH